MGVGLLPDSALARIRQLVVDTMGDSCLRLQRTDAGTDNHNRPLYTYEPVGDPLVCGIKPAGGPGQSSSRDDVGGVVIADYILRLPYGTELNRHDQIRIVGRHGETLPQPIDTEIIGEVERGLTVIIVKLRVVLYGN